MLYKILNRTCLCHRWLPVLFTFFTATIAAQDSTRSLSVTKDRTLYIRQVKEDSTKKMVELHALIPTLRYELRYATTNNFMHRRMYPAGTNVTFLRQPVAQALKAVQAELKSKGYGLKIFDAYRPYSVTVKFWELVKDERYVANPAKGSGHNRGIAVDLTLIYLKTGKPVDMGTGFDNFSDTAHHGFEALPEEILQDRMLLKTTMEKHGFKALDTEWWHYYWADGNRFEVLDISFTQLQQKIK